MIAALYVETGGTYFGLPHVDPWDLKRDARGYAGPWPVVAHPPCNRWSMLANVVQARWGHKVGDDGGTFAAALTAVRKFGGILEHPAFTMAWAHHGLLRPTYGCWSRSLFDPGWVAEVYQRNYGHRANKRTWLYCHGDPPPLDWSAPSAPEAWIPTDRPTSEMSVENMPKAERRHTPPAFRDLLISIAESVER